MAQFKVLGSVLLFFTLLLRISVPNLGFPQWSSKVLEFDGWFLKALNFIFKKHEKKIPV